MIRACRALCTAFVALIASLALTAGLGAVDSTAIPLAPHPTGRVVSSEGLIQVSTTASRHVKTWIYSIEDGGYVYAGRRSTVKVAGKKVSVKISFAGGGSGAYKGKRSFGKKKIAIYGHEESSGVVVYFASARSKKAVKVKYFSE